MTTEYEQLIQGMIDEKKSRLASVSGRGKAKDEAALMSDIRFLEVELERYQQGMSIFRSKGVPKVERWGKEEAEEAREEPPAR